MDVPDWVKAWVAFRRGEEEDNVLLRITARQKLNALALAEVNRGGADVRPVP